MKHLEYAKQTYFEHFEDSMKFFGLSFKASFYFFIHAINPNVFEKSGSRTIFKLNEVIAKKIAEAEMRRKNYI